MRKVKRQKVKVKSTGKKSKLFRFLLLNCGFAFCLFTFALNCYAASDTENFNLGAVLYKKGDYQKAIDAFNRALTSDNRQIEADVSYNLGNCKYKLGKSNEKSDLSAAVSLMREALDYYKRAVEIDQKNTDARFNHEFVDKEVKVLLEKLKQQEPKSDKQKGQQKDRQKQGADKKDKEESGQAEQEKEKEGQKESQQEKEEQEEGKAAKEELQEEGESKELSESSARTLLERYGREELKPDYLDKRELKGYDREVARDW